MIARQKYMRPSVCSSARDAMPALFLLDAFSELCRVLLWTCVFRAAFRLCSAWVGDQRALFRRQLLEPAQRHIHEWPAKYVTLGYALFTTGVGWACFLNLLQLEDALFMRAVCAGFLLFDAMRVHQALVDCQAVRFERRFELALREQYGRRSANSAWSAAELERFKRRGDAAADTIKLQDPCEAAFHHASTVAALYGLGMGEEAAHSALLAYLFGEVAVVLHLLLWFLRQERARHRGSPLHGVFAPLAAAAHLATSLAYVVLRLGMFAYSGWVVIGRDLAQSRNPVSLLMLLVLGFLFGKNVQWAAALVAGGETRAICSVRDGPRRGRQQQ